MKKKIISALCLSIVLSIATVFPVFAANAQNRAEIDTEITTKNGER